jgi:hypothetical protein
MIPRVLILYRALPGAAWSRTYDLALSGGHVIDPANGCDLYVAKRENRLIRRFTPAGRYLGGWSCPGKASPLTLEHAGHIRAGLQTRNKLGRLESRLATMD